MGNWQGTWGLSKEGLAEAKASGELLQHSLLGKWEFAAWYRKNK